MNELELRQLRRFQSPAILDYGAQNFFDLAAAIVESVEEVGPNVPATGFRERIVLLDEGKTRSGKSKLASLAKKYLAVLLATKGLNYQFNNLTYERDGEEKARIFGRVTTDRRKPFNGAELDAADEELEDAVFFDLTRYSHGRIIEVPAITSVETATGRYGRVLGTRTAENLILHQGMYFEDLPYRTFVAVCTSGFWPKILSLYREEVNLANTLDEAQEAAYIFGQDPPEDKEAWEEQKREGASLDQIEVIEQQTQDMYQVLRRVIPQVRYEYMNILIPAELQSLVPDESLIKIYTNWWNEIHTNKYIIERLVRATNPAKRTPEEHILLAYDNPTLTELDLPDVGALFERIKNRRYRTLF